MIERVLVLSALACAGVNAFGHLPEIIHEDNTFAPTARPTTTPAPTPTPLPCEDYGADQAACPIYYGSGCFWGYDSTGTYYYYGAQTCTSQDPCSRDDMTDEWSCEDAASMSMSLDQCVWNGASCETDECSYYHDQASCPSSSYGSQCFWGWGPGGMDVMCSSIDPCSRNGANDEYMCGDNMDQCAWNEASYSCETDECSYYLDEASCPSSGYGSQCFWTWGSWSGDNICTSNDPCSSGDEWSCEDSSSMSTDQCAWNGASCETSECSYASDEATCTGNGCYWVWGFSGDEVCRSWE